MKKLTNYIPTPNFLELTLQSDDSSIDGFTYKMMKLVNDKIAEMHYLSIYYTLPVRLQDSLTLYTLLRFKQKFLLRTNKIFNLKGHTSSELLEKGKLVGLDTEPKNGVINGKLSES